MKIICVNDDGTVTTVRCRKIEPATLKPGFIIVDEDYTLDLRNVIKIVEG